MRIAISEIAEGAPLYRHYSCQIDAQPAYVEIDPYSETADADWSGEIGNAIPSAVFHGLRIRVAVPNDVDGAALYEYLTGDEAQGLIGRIIDGWAEEWDGNNFVGRRTDDSVAAEVELENDLHDLQCREIADVANYFYGEVGEIGARHEAGQSIQEIAAWLVGAAESNVVFDGDVEGFVEEVIKENE
jgi:hypothetical protein